MRIIVRRPHAYELKAKDQSIEIPGIVFLDADGKVIGTAPLETAKKLVAKMNELTR